jgi:hypothetical protein
MIVIARNPGGVMKQSVNIQLNLKGLLRHPLNVNRMGILTMTLLRFAPYIQYQLFGSAFFLQLGTGISYVLSNNFTQTHYIVNNNVTLPDGTTIPNLTFTNGTRTETINSGSVSSIQSVLFSGIVSAGYGFSIGDFVFSPRVN